MAEAFAGVLGGGVAEAFSVGSKPAEQVHPKVVQVMLERGIDLGSKTPKGLKDLPEGVFDIVVGMGCEDACPAQRAGKVIAWDIPDPKNQSVERVREIRDQIEGQVKALLRGLSG